MQGRSFSFLPGWRLDRSCCLFVSFFELLLYYELQYQRRKLGLQPFVDQFSHRIRWELLRGGRCRTFRPVVRIVRVQALDRRHECALLLRCGAVGGCFFCQNGPRHARVLQNGPRTAASVNRLLPPKLPIPRRQRRPARGGVPLVTRPPLPLL